MLVSLKVLTACGLDVLIGDPRWFPHPVKLIGMMVHWYESVALRWVCGKVGRYIAGAVLAVSLPSLCYVSAEWLIATTSQLNEWVGHVVWVVLGYTTLAARDLADHAHQVYHALMAGSLKEARASVSQIVGRDTATLSEPEVIRATIETVAESSSDGVVAPLLYLAVGGPPLALAYKAVNTMDSMIGHRTQKYQYFGWASARGDDVLNWIPSRLSGIFLAVASAFWLRNGRRAWRIFLRDGRKHLSPNSGWPEAAMAGALQVQLGGTNYYRGECVKRQLIGDDRSSLMPRQIHVAIQLMLIASGMLLAVLIGVLSL